ncbi:MAG: TIR domain-containing protein [Candidatus Sedimenticola sp. (ex Thyasira tokunagai)]
MNTISDYGIVHISNLHLSARYRFTNDRKHGWRETVPTDIGETLSGIDKNKRFLVVSGDITSSGAKKDFDVALSYIYDLMDTCKVSPRNTILVPGNHDRNWMAESGCELDNFNSWCGKVNCRSSSNQQNVLYFEECNVAFVLLDSTQDRKRGTGRITEKQLSKIRIELSSLHLEKTVLFAVSHHGLDRRLVGDHRIENPDALYSFIDEWGVDVLLHSGGHVGDLSWTAYESKYGKLISVAGGALTEENWRASVQNTGYQIIRGQGDRSITITPRYYGFSSEKMFSTFNGDEKIALSPRTEIRPNPAPISRTHKKTLSKKDIDYVFSCLNRLPQNDLEDLVFDDLNVELDLYNPIKECRNDFNNRLVNYFSNEKSMDVLLEAIRKYNADGNYKKLRVFISSSDKDRESAIKLTRMLKNKGHYIWSYFDDLKPGDNISERIEKGLRYSDVLLLLWSDNASKSKWVLKEIEWALSSNSLNKKQIILLLLAGSALPSILSNYPQIKSNSNQDIDESTIKKLEELLQEARSESRNNA